MTTPATPWVLSSDGTLLSLRHGDFATEARLELHRQGWSESLDKLRGVVEAGA